MTDGAADEGRIARAEQLIASLGGVVDARIVTDGEGDIAEVHVLSDASFSGKQVVRNVESALLAEMGLDIDHRKVSVAQLKNGRARSDLGEGQETRKRPSPSARVEFLDFELRRRAGDEVTCRVTLTKRDEEGAGTAQGVDSAPSRLSTAASAVIEALDSLLTPDFRLTIETVRRHEANGRDLVVAVVLARKGRSSTVLSGSALVADAPEEAAALACLDALNRWLGGQG